MLLAFCSNVTQAEISFILPHSMETTIYLKTGHRNQTYRTMWQKPRGCMQSALRSARREGWKAGEKGDSWFIPRESMPFVNYANKDVNWPTLNVPLSKQDYNERGATASGHKTVPLSRSTDDMCSHKLCTWSLLSLAVTLSNGCGQVKPQITKIKAT